MTVRSDHASDRDARSTLAYLGRSAQRQLRLTARVDCGRRELRQTVRVGEDSCDVLADAQSRLVRACADNVTHSACRPGDEKVTVALARAASAWFSGHVDHLIALVRIRNTRRSVCREVKDMAPLVQKQSPSATATADTRIQHARLEHLVQAA